MSRFAREQLQPLVRKMDEESKMSKDIIKAMFDQGVSSIEREMAREMEAMGRGREREREKGPHSPDLYCLCFT